MRVKGILCLNNLGTVPHHSRSSYGTKMTPLSPGNTMLLKEKGGWESILRQVAKKSRVPEEERGVCNSQGRGKDK